MSGQSDEARRRPSEALPFEPRRLGFWSLEPPTAPRGAGSSHYGAASRAQRNPVREFHVADPMALRFDERM